MSSFLELVQDLHREIDGAGDPPATVAGLSGLQASMVAWVRSAWTDIQMENGGNWSFLMRDFTFNTVAATDTYAYGAVTDVDAAAFITRFQRWHIKDTTHRPTIYLLSAGSSTKSRLTYIGWDRFADLYHGSTVTSGKPIHITIDPRDRLVLGPNPNDVYVVEGEFVRSPQILTVDGDVPEVRTHFHEMIVFRAIAKYGFVHVVQEALARSADEYPARSGAFYSAYSLARGMRMGRPLA